MTEQVARRCREHDGDERSLRTALLEDIRQRVPFEAFGPPPCGGSHCAYIPAAGQ